MRDIESTTLTLDQFEALRLCDSENMGQEEAGLEMGVSRGTVQRLLYSARKQMVDAILHNKAIIINLNESEACDEGNNPDQRKCRTRGHGQ